MAHGIYDVIRGSASTRAQGLNDHHNDTELALRLELQESLACWYELLLNSSEREARRAIIDQLRTMQAKVAATFRARQHGESDHCIVSFLASRTRTRFSTIKPPRFSLFGNDFVFYVEVGRDKIRKKLSTTFVDAHSGNAVRPEITMDENFITIAFSDEEKERISVYDFLRKCGLELHINTIIHHVEYTSHPTERWLEGAQRSLTQMLYEVSNEDNDFFFYSNLFKVTLIQLDQQAYAPGGLPDTPRRLENELSMQERGARIEKAFKAYFQLPEPFLQTIQHAPVQQGKVGTFNIQVLMELNQPHELYCFGSQDVHATDKHMFSCDIVGDEVNVTVLE